MANTIKILTTLEYLGTYPDKDTKSHHYFGVVLQAGVSGNETIQVTADQAILLQPWSWKESEVRIFLYDGTNLSTELVLEPSIKHQANPTLNPHGAYSLEQSIVEGRLRTDFGQAFNAQDFAWIDATTPMKRDPMRAQYPWPAYLAQVSRYPFPIPHLLNLAYIVKVDDSNAPVPGAQYVAAMKFVVNNDGQNDLTYAPETDQRPTPGSDGSICIPYQLNGQYTADLMTCTRAITLPKPLVPPSTVLASALAEDSDWQAHLVPGCADLFDFPGRVIDAVRKDCQDNCGDLQTAVAKEFSAFVTSVLNVQRKMIVFGYQKCPNGKSLLNRLCDRWVGEAGPTEYKGRSEFAKAFVDQMRSQLEHDQSAAGQNQAYSQWLSLLQKNASLANYSLLAGAPLTVTAERLSDRLVELEHLQSQFSQSEVLAALLLAQWDQWMQSNPNVVDDALYPSFRASASTAMETVNVREILRQGNIGGKLETKHSPADNISWDTIIKSVQGTTQEIQTSRQNLHDTISSEFDSRVRTLLATPLPVTPALQMSGNLVKLVADAASDGTALRLASLVPEPKDSNATRPVLPTRTSEGLSIMLAGLSSGDDNDAKDSLRTMSGLCVLIRDRPRDNSITDWRCLNIGHPMTTPPSKTGQPRNPAVPAVSGLPDPIVVPVPMHNQDDLRRAILTYNNQPLMSESPAHGFSNGLVPTPTGAPDRLIAFQHPAVSTELPPNSPWKIPGLAFGHSYDLLIGRVSNSGALPVEFADPVAGPAILSLNTINAKFGAAKASKKQKQASGPSISGVSYQRTVPITELRFGFGVKGSGPQSPARLDLPPIPADAHPRASELYPSPDISKPPALNGDVTIDPKKQRAAFPLVLLTPYKGKLSLAAQQKAFDSFTMGIRKPTTDLLTWDRWMAAAGSGTLTDRINAWTAFHYLAREENRNNDLALDDPAVDRLSIKIEGLGNDINDTQAWQAPSTILQWNAGNTSVQNAAPARALVIKTVEAPSQQRLTTSPNTWTLTLGPGEIAKITLTPNIKDDNGCFAAGIASNLPGYTFLAEAAKKDIPSADDLRAALQIKPPTMVSSKTVDFELRLDTVANHEQVRAVDLQTQVWRWDGRPSALFPFNNSFVPDHPNQPTDVQLRWELETFSARLPSDATVRPMARRGSTPKSGAQSQAASSSDQGANYFFVAHDDRETELGATFYRAGVTAFNRYGSLVPDNPQSSHVQGAALPPPTRSVSTLTAFASVPGADGGWVRRFVPARLPAAVLDGYVPPKPAIKFIVPLTGATDNANPVQASVLIVVQGPWYAIAGLAEDICVRITESDPIPDQAHPGQTLSFPEAGPDPIWFKEKRANLPTQYRPYNSIYAHDPEKSGFHGPVGHTFDSFDDDPLWVNCSFVLDPPKPTAFATGRSSFACVQFQRIIRSEGVVVPDKDGKLVTPPSGTKIQSVPTDPVWIQFLPSRFSAFEDEARELLLDVTGQSASIKRADAIIHLSDRTNPIQDKKSHLLFGLLLTEEVEDLLGRKGQERFVDFLVNSASDSDSTAASWKYPTPPNSPKPATAKLVGRIIAVERQVYVSPFTPGGAECDVASTTNGPFVPTCGLVNYQELWQELFPDGDRDAVARIVAVSPPITQSISLTCDQRE